MLGWFGTSWNEVWTSIKTFFVDTWNSIASFFTGIVTGIRDFFVNTWTSISNTFTAIVTAIQTVATTVFTAIRDFFHLEQHLRHDFQCDECYFFCGIVYLESNQFSGFQCSERHPVGGV